MKFKSINCEIPGLIRHCSPLRSLAHKGLAIRSKLGTALFKIEGPGMLAPVYWSERARWTLDLRDLTGAFHAAQYVSDNFDRLAAHGIESAHDFETVLGDGSDDSRARSIYYGAYCDASDGRPLTTPERKALAKIVLWVAERVS